MSDSIEAHVTATPAECERVFACLRLAPRTAQDLHGVTKIPLVRVFDALERMQKRGAVRADGALWIALEVRS